MVKCEVAKRTLKLYSWVPSLLQVCSSFRARSFNCGIRVEKHSNDRDSCALHSAKSFVLCFGQEPRIFDLRGGAFAGEHVGNFSGSVGLAVDVRLV
jgi:hypothetical protein